MKDIFIIAEAGINHGGDLQTAKLLMAYAKNVGACAVKFQVYDTDRRVAKDNPAYDILKKCELTYVQHKELKLLADQFAFEYFATPFDLDAVEFLLGELKCKRIKLSSFDVVNIQFLLGINQLIKNKYPTTQVILSVGMATKQEIDAALNALEDVSDISILHCVSSYPTPPEEINLGAIQTLKEYYLTGHWAKRVKRIGFSDHTKDINASALATLLGAEVIEKHFTIDYNNGACDNPVSLDVGDFYKMTQLIKQYQAMLGSGELGLKEIEKSATIFRRLT